MDRRDLKVIFMGTPEFAGTNLKALIDAGYSIVLVLCQPDKPVGRKHILTAPPVKVIAQENGIEVYQPDTLKTDEALSRVQSYDADLIVTAAYGKILPKAILDLPKYGCINCHGSLLPARRGSAPVQRAILEGDKVTGITFMKMDVGMDTGDIIDKIEVEIDPNEHTESLMNKLAEASAAKLPEIIDKWVAGELTTTKQDDSLATACPPIRPEEGEFTWDQDATAIHNRVRALSAWPGAFVMKDVNKLKILDSVVLEDESIIPDELKNVEPGIVVKAKGENLIVKCGRGFLKVMELQVPGGKRLMSRDCAHNFTVGKPII
ncbi:methionyl-tRNA formyltransferase [Ruminococcaceae bacterium YAD3003]|nr:methionyl-tRNA formyltransferase [Ruminococcaceae bacterium YAD3003]